MLFELFHTHTCSLDKDVKLYWRKEDYKSKKYENIYDHMSWMTKHTHIHTPSPSLLCLYSHRLLTSFWKMIWGDPDVPSHWPMVSREGPSWRELQMPPSFKNPWALVSRLTPNSNERAKGGSAPLQQQHHSHLTKNGEEDTRQAEESTIKFVSVEDQTKIPG